MDKAQDSLAGGRVLPTTGIHNFRDYGGYATRDGRRMVSGKLFRSAQHAGATSDDLAIVDALDLDAVIDFRGDRERSGQPCLRGPGFRADVLYETEDTAGLAPHIRAAMGVTCPEEARKALAAGYREIPYRPVLGRIMARYFDALEHYDGATLVHCMAGKDRTGLAVALLHTLMGVHRDDMMHDYLLTNELGNSDERIAEGLETARKMFGADLDETVLRAVMMVHPTYLDAAFDEIAKRHGTIETYLRDVLGRSDQNLNALREKLAE